MKNKIAPASNFYEAVNSVLIKHKVSSFKVNKGEIKKEIEKAVSPLFCSYYKGVTSYLHTATKTADLELARDAFYKIFRVPYRGQKTDIAAARALSASLME